MSGQIAMFICLWIVQAFLGVGSLNLDTFKEKNIITASKTKIEELVSITHDTTTQLSTAISNKTKVVKSINRLYPYAVLFGGTCGGTIISSKWIITAAHCTIGSSGRRVLAGTDNSADDSGIIRKVKRKILHPLFLVGPFWLNVREYSLRQVRARFDFVLVELEEPLPLDGITMKAAKLNRTYKLAPRTKVSFAGYGADYHGGFMKNNMHVRKFELLPKEECARIKGYNSLDMVCAKGISPNPDFACQGDSGSGLVDENGVLIGVTSWIEDDAVECRNGAIVYFAKIAAVRRWIHEVTKV